VAALTAKVAELEKDLEKVGRFRQEDLTSFDLQIKHFRGRTERAEAEKEKLETRIEVALALITHLNENIAAIEGEVKKLRVKTSDIEDSEDVGWNEAVDEVLAIISKFKEGK
jgi:hypothetical protein